LVIPHSHGRLSGDQQASGLGGMITDAIGLSFCDAKGGTVINYTKLTVLVAVGLFTGVAVDHSIG